MTVLLSSMFFALAVLAAVAGLDAQALALFVVGLIQSPLQELILKNKVDGTTAATVTLLVSLVLAGVTTWVTAGFSDIPAWSSSDPTPFVGYIVTKWSVVYALSQVVFSTLSKPVHEFAGTAPTP